MDSRGETRTRWGRSCVSVTDQQTLLLVFKEFDLDDNLLCVFVPVCFSGADSERLQTG